MSMVCSYRGVERVWELSVPDFLLGRAGENSPPLLDLFPDVKITRLDARIWKEDGMNWIEEFQGWRGTLRNDKEIEGDGKKRIQMRDVIAAVEPSLRMQSLESRDTLAQTNYLKIGAGLELTVLGGVANKAARYCTGAVKAEVLIPEVHEPVWRIGRSRPRRLRLNTKGSLLLAV